MFKAHKETSMLTNKVPRVIWDMGTVARVQALVQNCDTEFQWFSELEVLPDYTFRISGIHIPEQEVSGTTADSEVKEISAFYEKMMVEGKDDLINRLCVHGHSHVNMAVSPSSTDQNTFSSLSFKHNVRVIVNKKGDINIDFRDDERKITFWSLPFEMELPGTDVNEALLDLKSKIKVKTYNTYHSPHGHYDEVTKRWVSHDTDFFGEKTDPTKKEVPKNEFFEEGWEDYPFSKGDIDRQPTWVRRNLAFKNRKKGLKLV